MGGVVVPPHHQEVPTLLAQSLCKLFLKLISHLLQVHNKIPKALRHLIKKYVIVENP